MKKETSETWGWFIEKLKSDLCMGECLGWSLISDIQKVRKHPSLIFFISTTFCLE